MSALRTRSGLRIAGPPTVDSTFEATCRRSIAIDGESEGAGIPLRAQTIPLARPRRTPQNQQHARQRHSIRHRGQIMRAITWLLAYSFLILPACGEDSAPSEKIAAPDLQHGEAVLPADKASVDAPLRRAADQPWIELSNLRKVRLPNGTSVFEVDYRVVAEPIQDACLICKNVAGRRIQPLESRALEKEGTLQLSSIGEPAPGLEEMELWVEFGKGAFRPSPRSVGFKISNSVALGKIGQFTQPREWKVEEQRAYEAQQKAQLPAKPVPPLDPPKGFVLSGDQRLLPGMSVKFFAGPTGWQDAESLGEWRGMVVLRRPGEPAPADGRQPLTAPRHHVAVSEAVLKQAQSKPASFVPSIKLLHGTLSVLTEDLEPVTDKTPLQPGATIRIAGQAGGWSDAVCLKLPAAGKVLVKEIGSFQREYDVELSQLAIQKAVVTELQKPDAAMAFAATLEKLDAEWAAERRKRAHVHDYLATFPLPDGHQPLAADTSVEKGDRLRASWANKWYNVTAVAKSTEGPVEIEWEGFKGGWKEFLSRKSLFVVGKPSQPADNAPEDVSTVRRKPAGKCTLTLDSAGRKRIAVAKVVMEVTGLELKDSLEVLSETPIMLRHTLTLEEAEAFRKAIESAGGKATVQPND